MTDVYKEFKEFITRGNVFLLIAAAVFFFIVKPINVLNERRRRGEEPEPEELSDEAALLTEIRDLLRDRSGV